MTIYDSREEFEKSEFSKPSGEFNGCVIIPTGYKHDSGFNCMKFALTSHNDVVGCVGGGSDVINLNGIGGYGKYDEHYIERIQTQKVDIVDWSIDCLPNGLIRIFSSKPLSIDDIICSNFQLYANEQKKQNSRKE